MLSFLSPLFLLGAAAAAVPIVLHFLNREPDARVMFSAVKLLRHAPVEHTRKRRLRQLLLLALRVATLVLLALAFARPFFATGAAVASSGVTVVALDTSYSMSAPGRFERAKQLARAAIDRAPAGDLIGVVTFSDRAEVGVKPTADRVPTAGAFPLSTSLDSIGPLAATVACCAALDAVLAGGPAVDLAPFPLTGLRLALPQTMVLENVEPAVARAFESALAALGKAGARIADIPLRELAELPQINAKGGLAAPEAYALHRSLIAKAEKMYDPRVLVRILRGQEQDAADYIELLNARADFIQRVAAVTAPYDALVMPTVPVTAPRVADLALDDAYRHANFLVLRNPSIANFLDRCSISIPCHRAGDAPVGLMLIGEHDADRRLLAIAAAIEAVVSPRSVQAESQRL